MFEHKGSFVLLCGYLTYCRLVLIAGCVLIPPLNDTDAAL